MQEKIKRRVSKVNIKLIGLFIIILAVIAGLSILKELSNQLKPVTETSVSEMKKIPEDVAQTIGKPAPTELVEDTRSKEITTIPTPIKSILTPVRVPILLYHYVEYVRDKKDTIRQSLNVNPNIFEEQVTTLQQAGYTFITAKQLGEVIDGKAQLPLSPVLITFDDGYWDLDTVVLPILKKYHVKATAYIVPGFIGNTNNLSSTQLQDVINSGLVDVGAHTVHHVSLKGKLFPIAQYEIEKSKALLEQTYHIGVVSFAYPNGSFDQQAINIVRDAGFTTAVSTIPGIEQSNSNRFFLYRLRPGYKTGQILLNYLQQSTFKTH